MARHEKGLFHEIVEFSRGRYNTDKATYHVHATLEMVAAPSEIDCDTDLERQYLELWDEVPQGKGFTLPGRQILHCTFGSVLTDEKFGPLVADILHQHPDTYTAVLDDHFTRHLEALQSGM